MRVGEVLDQRYVVRRELGRGAMSYVFEAEQRFTGRLVALKVSRVETLPPPPAPARTGGAERVLAQARVLGALRHRAIVEAFDAGTLADGRSYVAMQLVDGPSLDGVLAVRSSLALETALDMALELCDALDHAHGRGYAHGQIHPRHVLLPRAEGGPRAMLIDFGDWAASMGELAGPPLDRAAAHADLFMLAGTLYACLTGGEPPALPVPGAAAPELVPDLADVRPDTPSAIAEVVMRALHPRESKRFPEARALGRALERAREGMSPSAPPFSYVPVAGPVQLELELGSSGPPADGKGSAAPRDDEGTPAPTVVTDVGPRAENEPHKRDRTRYGVDLDVTLNSLNNFYAAQAMNLSADGIFVATHIFQPIGTRCELTIHLPDVPRPIKGVGEVRWVRTRPGPGDAPPGMGIRFVEVQPGARELVESFLTTRQPLVYED
ncbi:MAG: PilZ domain-containing protein [Myxococcales bacterium]|nr:PilZ domain-containing protein [Myxococcales bacterium]